MFFLFFFFSSRRRHTRWNCDWSSDVCSSDLRLTRACGSIGTCRELPPSDRLTRQTLSSRKSPDADSTCINPDTFAYRRSEERRVGKECRIQWWPLHYKKKNIKKSEIQHYDVA